MKLFPCRAFLLAASLAAAASGATAQPTEGTSADELVSAGLKALRQIDEDRASDLWDDTSAFVKTSKPRDQFLKELREARSTVGTVRKRDWASVVRVQYLDGSVTPPPGLYANIDYATRLANGTTVFEKLSFRLEPNGWRLTGYQPRQNQ